LQDKELPYGGIDGSWCGRQLFQCQTKHGLLVPADVVVKEDSLLRTFGEYLSEYPNYLIAL
jgi:hypothetical protein